MRASRLTSSDLLGRGASSGFFSIFCFRLSLLPGRDDLSASINLPAERLAVGVLPRSVFELDAMVAGCGEPAACEDVMDDDECECLGRAGGIGPRTSMAGSLGDPQPTATWGGVMEHGHQVGESAAECKAMADLFRLRLPLQAPHPEFLPHTPTSHLTIHSLSA